MPQSASKRTDSQQEWPDRLLTLDETSDVIRISRRKLHDLIDQEKLRAIRIGRSVRIRWSDLLAFMETGG
jgi:excisionase family DNA binding protein